MAKSLEYQLDGLRYGLAWAVLLMAQSLSTEQDTLATGSGQAEAD